MFDVEIHSIGNAEFSQVSLTAWKFGDPLPTLSGIQNSFEGSWYWESTSTGPVYYERFKENPTEPFVSALTFSLDLVMTADGKLYEEHGIVVQGGLRVDTGSGVGPIVNSTATIQFETSFAESTGEAQLTYDPQSDDIHWRTTREPTSNGYPTSYLPNDVILERSSTTPRKGA